MIREGVDGLEADVGAVRHDLQPVVAARAFDRRDHELEVLGAVVVREDEEAVAVVGGTVVLDVVLDALPTRRDQPRRAVRDRRRRRTRPRW